MTSAPTGKAFAVRFEDLLRWDYLSISLARFAHVKAPLVEASKLFSVRKEVVPDSDLESGAVKMVCKVSFDGSIHLGRENTRMTQYLAKPGDILVSKIRARQGSVGLLNSNHGNASVTIHYRVLTPTAEINPEYAWLALRSNYVRSQLLAATGGAMKGEISEGALLSLQIPCPKTELQLAIVDYWQEAQNAFDKAQKTLVSPVAALNKQLLEFYGKATTIDVIHSRFFAINFGDLMGWDVKSGRASAFRLTRLSLFEGKRALFARF